ncbi:MAG: hypothetical protein FJZ58_01160 [Chlamydiae bacterium]|nr:hypothetical protein [Chlamydiota bacterium]
MHTKFPILPSSWEEERSVWEEKARQARASYPLKTPTSLPKMVGITSKTARFLRGKALVYLIREDKNKIFLRYVSRKPFTYLMRLLRSYLSKQSFHRKEDLFFYGLRNEHDFIARASHKKSLLVLGFSYCHKPLECPSGRFSDQCQNAQDHPVCQQCFIGKASLLAKRTNAHILYIPTIHYIGEKLLELQYHNPGRPLTFIITACELSLTMFGDWGHMIGAKGIGIRLDGRICNTMKAFHLSEHGIKPGLTQVLDTTQETLLSLLNTLCTSAYGEKA